MIFSSKSVALVVSLFVSVMSTLSCTFVEGLSPIVFVIVASASFFSCYGMSFILLEITVFKELRKVYEQIVNLEGERETLLNSIDKVPFTKMSTELFRFSQKKNIELTKLKEVEAFRRQFLADIAHELKTPVHTAQGYIETLIDGAIDDLEVRDRFLSKTQRSLENLDFIIRDLINISHLETGEVRLDLARHHLEELIERVVHQLEETAEKKGKVITVNYIGKRPFAVDVDEYRMGQVLTNLVNNSLNYSGDNKNLWITVRANEEADSYLVEVKDDGIGIDQEHQSHIFNRFYRVDKSRSRAHGGTGLGLAIVKHILEAHKSQIHLKSSLGKGALFSFTLPKSRAYFTLSKNKELTARGKR